MPRIVYFPSGAVGLFISFPFGLLLLAGTDLFVSLLFRFLSLSMSPFTRFWSVIGVLCLSPRTVAVSVWGFALRFVRLRRSLWALAVVVVAINTRPVAIIISIFFIKSKILEE